jgi:hypothetical protein
MLSGVPVLSPQQVKLSGVRQSKITIVKVGRIGAQCNFNGLMEDLEI